MRALRIARPGGPDALTFEDTPEPEAVTGDVLVEVCAAGFTPNELTWPSTYVDRAGRTRTPSIVAHEVSGVVAALGFGTTGFDVGDEVFGLTDAYRDGTAAGFVSVDVRNLAPKPSSLDHAHAASLPQTALTAWQGLFRHGNLHDGQRVMVHGAGGAVGGLAVQFARRAGARVIGTGFSDVEDVARRLGADEFISLDDGGLESAPSEVDLVFDTIGGDVLASSIGLVRDGGCVVSIVVPPPAWDRGISRFFVVEPNRSELEAIAALVDADEIVPHVAAVYPLRDGRQAFLDKQQGLPGKVVLQP